MIEAGNLNTRYFCTMLKRRIMKNTRSIYW